MRRRPRILPALAVAFLWIAPAAAQVQIPERTDRYVNDYAEILSPKEESALSSLLRTLDEQTGNQIVIFSLGSLEGTTPEQVTLKAAETWKPGEAGRDNGVVVGVFPNDRKARIEVGYGLEPVIPDALAATIIRDRMGPHFAQGRWYAGLRAGVESLAEAAAREYKRPEKPGRAQPVGRPLLLLVPFLIVGLWFGLFSWFSGRRYDEYGSRGARRGYGRRHLGGGLLLGGLGLGHGRRRGGFGGFGGGGLGGFGGGGGGFGGGGATGSW